MSCISFTDLKTSLSAHMKMNQKTVDRFVTLYFLYLTADSAADYTTMCVCVCVFSSAVFAIWNSRRRAAGVCAGGAWQEQSSPGGSEDCRVDRSTPGLKRPERVGKRHSECSCI